MYVSLNEITWLTWISTGISSYLNKSFSHTFDIWYHCNVTMVLAMYFSWFSSKFYFKVYYDKVWKTWLPFSQSPLLITSILNDVCICMYICITCNTICMYMPACIRWCIECFVLSSKSSYAKMSKTFSSTGTSVETNAKVHPFTLVSWRMCIYYVYTHNTS